MMLFIKFATIEDPSDTQLSMVLSSKPKLCRLGSCMVSDYVFDVFPPPHL